MNIYKSPEKKKLEAKDKRSTSTLAYDMTMRDTQTHHPPYHQKSKRDSLWDKNMKPRELPKSALGAPMTTS